jgi:hypothetical protein
MSEHNTGSGNEDNEQKWCMHHLQHDSEMADKGAGKAQTAILNETRKLRPYIHVEGMECRCNSG